MQRSLVNLFPILAALLSFYFFFFFNLKKSPANATGVRDQVQFLGPEDPLEQEMATHSSILAWKIPWTEKPGRLQSMGLQSQESDTTEQLSTTS